MHPRKTSLLSCIYQCQPQKLRKFVFEKHFSKKSQCVLEKPLCCRAYTNANPKSCKTFHFENDSLKSVFEKCFSEESPMNPRKTSLLSYIYECQPQMHRKCFILKTSPTMRRL